MGNEKSQPTTVDQEPSCFFFIEDSEPYRVNLKDASPSFLQTLFGLPTPPNILKDKDKEGTCIIYQDNAWTTKLSKDSHYKVILPKTEVKEAAHSLNRIEILGPLNGWDIQCAIVCSQAAQFCGFGKDESKKEEIKKVFRESVDIEKHFDFLCPSIYGDVRYILARSTREGVLYIAFSDDDFNSMMARPTTVDTEFLNNDDVELTPIKGQCNEYIWRQLKNIPVSLILGRCLKSDIKRVVVCGHGVGGALANVFTLCLQLKLNLLKEDNSTLPKVVSITFGAPMCLSKDLVEEVGHPDNFFNIVNIEDPVPNVLDYAAGVANLPPYVKKTALERIEYLYKSILARTTKVFRKENDNQNQEDEHREITQKMEELNAFCTEKKIGFEDVVKSSFYPIGWYIICCEIKNDDVESDAGARTLFDSHEVDRRATVERLNNWNVCRVKNVHLIGKLLAKQKIQESAVPFHSINSYLKMVSQSITRNYRASCPKEHSELHNEGQSSLHSATIKNEFPAEANIRLTRRTKHFWWKKSVKETNIEILLEGKNLGFFALRHSDFSRLPIKKDIEFQTKRVSAERVELVGQFDEKCVYEQPSVDVATHFETIKVTTSETDIKEVQATTFADTFVDGLSPKLLLRAWQRGITSVIITESESRKEQLVDNNLLSQLYKLEKNSSKCKIGIRKPRLHTYSTKAAGEGFHALGEPEPELLDILKGIMDDLEDDLVIDVARTGKILPEIFALYLELGVTPYATLFFIKGADAVRTVLMKRVKKAFIKLGKIFTPKVPHAINFFGKIEENYSAMLCIYISALRNVQDQTINSADTMASIYQLEETLHKKYKALGFHGQDIEKILEQNPFKEEHSVASALEDSRRNILRRIQQSCDLFQLRQYLKEECYIGIVGPQDAGKSTLIKELWGLDVKNIGYTEHTENPHVYQVSGAKKLKVADFPGSTSIDEYMAKVIQVCGGMASFLILVMPYVGDISRIHLEEYRNTEGFQLPTLVCINKCGMYLTRSKDFQSKESVNKAKKRFANCLQVNKEDVFFTEFLDFSENMRGKGIADLAEVKKWIESKLTELDFYKDGDDELNHALNRPHDCSLQAQ